MHAEHRPLLVPQDGQPRPVRDVGGGSSTVAPSAAARSAVRSTSATAKYGIQYGGVSAGNWSAMSAIPPKSFPAMPHWVYISPTVTLQPKTRG